MFSIFMPFSLDSNHNHKAILITADVADGKMAAKILLGVADCSLSSGEDEEANWFCNKFGGVPNWMQDCLPSAYPKCSICQTLLYHVAQIYCPLEGSNYHRLLNIFCCCGLHCADRPESWKVLRSQCIVQKEVEAEKRHDKVKEQWMETWCHDANDWGDGDENDFSDVSNRLQDLAMSQMDPPTTCNSSEYNIITQNRTMADFPHNLPKFDSCYIHVLEEPEQRIGSLNYEENLLREYEKREGPLTELEKGAISNTGEKYEKSEVADRDRTFHKFQKRLRRCQEQCLRYQWNGSPLLFSGKVAPSHDLDDVPMCSNCHSKRVFELQLMPALSLILNKVESDIVAQKHQSKTELLEGSLLCNEHKLGKAATINQPEMVSASDCSSARIEFGTVFVYTCSKSCVKSQDGFNIPVEEFVVMQSDPDSKILQERFKVL